MNKIILGLFVVALALFVVGLGGCSANRLAEPLAATQADQSGTDAQVDVSINFEIPSPDTGGESGKFAVSDVIVTTTVYSKDAGGKTSTAQTGGDQQAKATQQTDASVPVDISVVPKLP